MIIWYKQMHDYNNGYNIDYIFKNCKGC